MSDTTAMQRDVVATRAAAPPLDEERLRRCRVMCFSDALPGRNGVGTYYDDLMHQLESKVDHAKLVCPQDIGTGVGAGIGFSLPGDSTQKMYIPNVWRDWRLARHTRPNVIVAATPGPFGLLAWFLAWRLRIPMIVGYHTQYDELVGLYWNRVFGTVGSRYLQWLDRRLFRAATTVVATSAELTQRAKEQGAREVITMGTPLGPEFVENPRSPLNDELSSVLFAGRLAPEKNLEAILEAARQLPHIRFVIAGDGPLREKIEAESRRRANLHYVGWTPRSRLLKVMDETDLLALPSKIESFGTIALEAMARQRLVVVSANCGIVRWESVAEGVYQVPENEELVDTIRRIAGLAPAQRAAKARCARACAERFNEATLRQWLDVILQAAGDAVHHG